ncbi:hypothetical protein CANCADRAFT_32943 [Tortispora caseinolytica NRRL Y-17796]|uniref:histone acetyltransferase n=1 Tax=Tortispora caseinolytica NRRL Y-17796 TaxID=767744 RepID=A0A1E4TDG8_9ASCO|nr:hypothetical protein CANCADRAFT_32943 [Tortispora caseinolytica NRRL Y-17796]
MPVIPSQVFFAGILITPWYESPYWAKKPGSESLISPLVPSPADILCVCHFCFKHTVDPKSLAIHIKQCPARLNGLEGAVRWTNERYRIVEIDGNEHSLFCECLCLFAKLFLENKAICCSVKTFDFFLLVDTTPDHLPGSIAHIPDSRHGQVIGYFSKEKLSWDDYNLACVLVFPFYQQKGLGQLLISFSYALSLKEGKLGSPEKPLSDLGRHSYFKYMSRVIADFICSQSASVSINDIASATGICQADVLSTLTDMNVLDTDARYLDKKTASYFLSGPHDYPAIRPAQIS